MGVRVERLFRLGQGQPGQRALRKVGRLNNTVPDEQRVVSGRWDMMGVDHVSLATGFLCERQSLVGQSKLTMLTFVFRLVGERELAHLADRMNAPEEEPDTSDAESCE